MNTPGTYHLNFDGRILLRGFWLYIWRVTSLDDTVLYVGRTGDSSSPYASSPFVRIGRHLDSRENAKSNTLRRRLIEKDFVPEECQFEFTAFGPIFPEQNNSADHRILRDQTGALEAMLANELRARGYNVIGVHHTKHKPTVDSAAQLQQFIEEQFPRLKSKPLK